MEVGKRCRTDAREASSCGFLGYNQNLNSWAARALLRPMKKDTDYKFCPISMPQFGPQSSSSWIQSLSWTVLPATDHSPSTRFLTTNRSSFHSYSTNQRNLKTIQGVQRKLVLNHHFIYHAPCFSWPQPKFLFPFPHTCQSVNVWEYKYLEEKMELSTPMFFTYLPMNHARRWIFTKSFGK